MDLERLAAAGEAMPDNLKTHEQLLFLTLRELYNNFRSGAVTRERGRREKQSILQAYEQLKFENSLFEEHVKLRHRLEFEVGSLHKCGCETCRKVARVFDGIERRDMPQDVKELQETTARLRDMVQQRSERNAELRTVIDRVGWIIDGEGTAEDKIARIKEAIKV